MSVYSCLWTDLGRLEVWEMMMRMILKLYGMNKGGDEAQLILNSPNDIEQVMDDNVIYVRREPYRHRQLGQARKPFRR